MLFRSNRTDDFETKTPGYSLFSVAMGFDFKLAKRYSSFYINGTNILDKAYYDHLSRLKPVNVYNMGRNITIGIIFPFGTTGSKPD